MHTADRQAPSASPESPAALLKELHRGAFGALWLARRLQGRQRGRLISVRRLPIAALEPAESGQLVSVAISAQGIAHPSVVKVLDVLRVENELWLLDEHIEGVSLAALMSHASVRNEPVPLGVALRLATDLARAARAVRGQLAPREELRVIWPETCLVASYGEALVADAGVADAFARCSLPRSNPAIVAQLAPEQLEGAPLDERADVFAVGRILWELLAHERSGLERSLERTRARVLAGSLPPLGTTERGSQVPVVVAELVDRATQRDPGQRPATLEDFVDALEALPKRLIASERQVGASIEPLVRRHMSDIRRSASLTAPRSGPISRAPSSSDQRASGSEPHQRSGAFPSTETPTRPEFPTSLSDELGFASESQSSPRLASVSPHAERPHDAGGSGVVLSPSLGNSLEIPRVPPWADPRAARNDKAVPPPKPGRAPKSAARSPDEPKAGAQGSALDAQPGAEGCAEPHRTQASAEPADRAARGTLPSIREASLPPESLASPGVPTFLGPSQPNSSRSRPTEARSTSDSCGVSDGVERPDGDAEPSETEAFAAAVGRRPRRLWVTFALLGLVAVAFAVRQLWPTTAPDGGGRVVPVSGASDTADRLPSPSDPDRAGHGLVRAPEVDEPSARAAPAVAGTRARAVAGGAEPATTAPSNGSTSPRATPSGVAPSDGPAPRERPRPPESAPALDPTERERYGI